MTRTPTSRRSRTRLELDLSEVEPSIAGPKRPQDRVPVRDAKQAFVDAFENDTGGAYRQRDEASRGVLPRERPAGVLGGRGRGRRGRAGGGRGARLDRGRRAAPRARRQRVGTARPRTGRDSRDHELHEHLEPLGHARRRPRRQEGRRARPRDEGLGQDQPRAGVQGRHRVPRQGRTHRVPRAARASTSSATAARPASATAARCRRRSRERSASAI